MKWKTRFCTHFSSLLVLFAIGGVLCPAYSKTIEVLCGVPGQSIGKALEHAQPGDVILIRGTCNEKVTVTTGHITLDGLGIGTVRGAGSTTPEAFNPLVAVEGAQGVIIKGLRVENGPGEAILIENGAAASLKTLTLQGKTAGLVVDAGSPAELAGSRMDSNCD